MTLKLTFMLLMAIALVGGGCKHDFTTAQPSGLYPLDSSVRMFSVGGEVNYPSRQLYENRMTLGMAIAAAGGFTASANKKKVALTHADGERRIIDCTQIPADEVEVVPGDYILVPRR
jgi:hypothetical protein